MKPILHEPHGKNRFCGPTAMSVVLGISTDDASRAIRKVTGKANVMGVHELHLLGALRGLGCGATYTPIIGKTTGLRWAREHRKLFAKQHVILITGNHYVTLLGNYAICALTKGTAVPLADMGKARGTAKGFITVHSLPSTTSVVPRPVSGLFKARPAGAERKAKEHAFKLAKQHDLDIEYQDDIGLIWVSRNGEDLDDPHEGDHYVDTWVEAGERAKSYIGKTLRK